MLTDHDKLRIFELRRRGFDEAAIADLLHTDYATLRDLGRARSHVLLVPVDDWAVDLPHVMP